MTITKNISVAPIIILISTILFVSSLQSMAQDKYIVSGKVEIVNDKIEETYITIFKDAEELSVTKVSSNGKFQFKLDFGHEFILEFSKDRFITKKWMVSTYVPDEVLQEDSQFPPFKLTISLFPSFQGMDISIFEQPIGLVMYDNETDDFDYDKSYDAQVKEEVKRVEEEAKRRATKKQTREQKYIAAITLGDKQMSEQKYSEAKTTYSKATKLKSEENYPKTQIQKIDELLAEKVRIEAEKAKMLADKQAIAEKYNAAITLGDEQMNEQKYSEAKTAYNEAIELKSEENYPKTQIQKIDELLAEKARIEAEEAKMLADKQAIDEKYNAAIDLGDKQMNEQKYSEAKTAYNEAIELKSEENYPKTQIQKIDELLAEKARIEAEEAKMLADKQAIDEKYNAAIDLGDKQMNEQKYSEAKTTYNNATKLKSEENYPKTQIQKIDELLAEKARIEAEEAKMLADKQALAEKYNAAITLGDKQMNEQKYSEAKTAYNEAIELKSEENYPKTQIQKIDELLAEKARIEAEEAKMLADKQAIDEIYNAAIELGDKQMNEQNYSEAKTAYNEAIELKSEENYPKTQIQKIDKLLAEQARIEAKQKERTRNYNEAMEKGGLHLGKEEYSVAKHHYRAASEIMPEEKLPKEKLEEIERLIEEKQAAARIAEEEKLERNKKPVDDKTEEQYQEFIQYGDKSFENKELSLSKFYYKKALKLKPEEYYPKKQLEKIKTANVSDKERQLISEYSQNVDLGDEEFEKQNFLIAKHYYGKALNIYPKYDYPNRQIEAINKLLKERETTKIKTEYLEIIEKADKAFDNGDISIARFYYKKAKALMPNEKYPIDRLEIIRKKIEK